MIYKSGSTCRPHYARYLNVILYAAGKKAHNFFLTVTPKGAPPGMYVYFKHYLISVLSGFPCPVFEVEGQQ